ncbi:MAG: DNA-binding MarR family transcriptional regulator [Planctomycetota bacterium]|jgi:DNA-binding MarR family transcriptional regulator
MPNQRADIRTQLLGYAFAWNSLERRLDSSLSAIRGISFAEYRILIALARSPNERASRVDLAESVGLTPSGVTRALQPLEKLRIIKTIKSERDARLALASLTKAGRELVDDASKVIDDLMTTLMARMSSRSSKLSDLLEDMQLR